MNDQSNEQPLNIHPYPKPGTIINGFTVAAPPKSATRRHAMETDDFTGSGGCHSALRQAELRKAAQSEPAQTER